MVSNAQLDNEKNNLIYQVDTLKDVIEEREEQLAEYYRENEDKTKVRITMNLISLNCFKDLKYIILHNDFFQRTGCVAWLS